MSFLRQKSSTKYKSSRASKSFHKSISGSLDRSKSTLSKLKAKRLFKKRNELKILVDAYDVTPMVMAPIREYCLGITKETMGSQIDMAKSSTTGDGIFSTMAPSTLALTSLIQSINVSSMFYSQTTNSSLIKTTECVTSQESLSWLKESEDEVEEATLAPEKIETMMPTRVQLLLVETPIIYIYEQESQSELKDTEEGKLVEQDNDMYDYLTIGKGRNRKTTAEEIQTEETILKTRGTQAERCKRKNSYSYASGWDMLDTYNGISAIPQGKTITKKYPHPDDIDYSEHLKKLDNEMMDLLHNPIFQEKLIILERILANNNYNEEQKRFRGLIEQDPFRPDIEFKYDMNLLWTFKSAKTEGHPVTTMEWNPANKDILAVGYGKFFYNDQKNGFVYCWNIKNPTQPEREIYYDVPVTSVSFATMKPNILAIGLYNGSVEVRDITTRDTILLALTGTAFSPANEPIWQVCWLPPDDYNPSIEMLCVVGEDGRVSRLARSRTLEVGIIPWMKTFPIESKLKGVYQPRHCPVTDVPLSKCSAALWFTKHPTDTNRYFVGTDEGTIHRCSRNYLNQHIDMFMAHNGPVYKCEFSPFCDKFFLTCGADWCINIWTEMQEKPLISLYKQMEPIEGACWSTANSTIIASICGTEIIIWDLQRRTYSPTAIHKSPTGCRNTLIQFTESGRNLVVADIEGNVHIFSMENMPFPPFYQTEMLLSVIRKALIIQHDIVDQLDKSC